MAWSCLVLARSSCSFVLAVAGFCRREERQGKQEVNQLHRGTKAEATAARSAAKKWTSISGRTTSWKQSTTSAKRSMTSCLDRTTSSKQRTNDVVAAKRDVVAAKHDVVAAKHDVRDQHSTTSERSKARRRLTCLSKLARAFLPPPPPPPCS